MFFGLVWLGLVFWFFGDRVSLCSPGCPGTHSVDQAGLELKNLPASTSQVLGLKACATTTWQSNWRGTHPATALASALKVDPW